MTPITPATPQQTLLVELACHPAAHGRHRLARMLARRWQMQQGQVTVFFHADAVAVAAPGHPEHAGWTACAEDAHMSLQVCSAALERRNMVLDSRSPFELSTLTQWMDRCAGGGPHLVLNRYAAS